ncbi:MAG: hypothetical protein ACK4M9_19615 [Anaerobacillus sp.]|uniref:hypothetical protein n=1 Tax=Anaerobacillus sp. TaxID=1872506 RepID=UPI003919691B
MKSLSASISLLGVFLVIAAWLVSNAITNLQPHFPSSITVDQPINSQYELILNEGWLYLYDTTNGQVWRKLDGTDSSWEVVKHFTEN